MPYYQTELTVAPAPPFDFEATACSSGWMELLPTTWDKERRALQRVQRLSDGAVVLLSLTSNGAIEQPQVSIEVSHGGELTARQQDEIMDAVKHMLRVDEDFSEFYTLCRERGERWARVTGGLGRILRSPAVFEDVVKTICTTNTFWASTRAMVKRLVQTCGEPYPADPARRAFPTPAAIAAADPATFAAAVRLGYRTEYVHTLAQRVASGELDLEALRDTSIATRDLKKKLLAIKGVGNYAAATLLTLLGRYDDLPVDSVFREFVAQEYFAEQQPTDKEAQAVYADWGKWKYLAYWFDIWTASRKRQEAKGDKK